MQAVAAKDQSANLQDIVNYNNTAVVSRIAKEVGLSKKEAEALFHDTKLFLYLCASRKDGPFVPSRAIDAAWHQFLLFTKDYRDFCHRFFGRFLHHQPHDSRNASKRGGALRTLRVAQSVFAWPLSPNWGDPAPAEVLAPCDSCGCDAACSDD